MSLLKKASIITTPTAYAEDYLYSIKPAQALGVEIIPDPNFDTDSTSYWNIATTGGTPRATKSYISNDKFMRLTYDLANGAALFRSGAIVSGKSYKVIFRAKGTANSAFASIGNNGDLGTVISNPTLTTSFQRYEFDITATQTVFRLYLSPSGVNIGDTLDIDNISLKEITDADFDFDRNSTGTRVNEDYLIETVATNTPRIDYTNGEPSILLEPSRTNNVTNSNDSFTANNTTITYNNINSPEGIQNGFKVECTSSGTAVFARTASIAFTDPVTFSAFVKYGNAQYLQFLDSNTSAHFFNFDLQNGVFGTSGSGTTNLKAVKFANGWYRVSGTFTGVAATATFRLYISNSNSAGYGAGTATVGDFYYAYGWQVENGSYATSLIHTSGSAVTRSQDVGSNAGNSDLISSVEGVLYVDANFKNITGGTYISISNAAGNRILIGTENGTGRVYGSSLVTTFSIDYDRYNKIAYCYKANERKIFLNGKSIYSSTASYTVPTGMNELSFDSTGAGSQKTQGNVKMVAVFKEALTDLELEKLTGYNNHELYMNYYNRLSYLGLVEEYNVESDINNYIL